MTKKLRSSSSQRVASLFTRQQGLAAAASPLPLPELAPAPAVRRSAQRAPAPGFAAHRAAGVKRVGSFAQRRRGK